MEELYVGVVVKDGKVVDIMAYPSPQEVMDNLRDSPHRQGSTHAPIYKVDEDGNSEFIDQAYLPD